MNTNTITWIIVAAILGASAIMIFGCEPKKWEFEEGQKVQHTLDGRVGIVIRKLPGFDKNRYEVRFVCNQLTTDTCIISEDGPIQNAPYAEVTCKEFELKHWRP